MKLVGFAVIALGLVAAVYGAYPWIAIQFMPRGRYHYYYINDEGKGWTALLLVAGVLLIGLGLWLIFGRRRRG